VLDEYESVPQKFVFFIDDNIIGHSTETKERAKLLFEGILRRGIKKHWISQSSINFAEDPELLRLAAKSGCRMIFLGIEAENEEQLREANKKVNLRKGVGSYRRVFRDIQQDGIGVIAGLIFGWDTDTPESMARRATFALRCGADSFQASVLTPLPGTELFNKVKSEGRLLYTNFPEDWQRYDYFEPTIRHPVMDIKTLDEAAEKAKRRIYSMPWILYRGLVTLLLTRKVITTMMLTLNYRHYRNIFLKGRYKTS
jgi:radical SAM superfamily enzyme YgiQ (UPF0313 family)